MYEDFAQIYDKFQEIDYNKFIEFYESIFDINKPHTIIDLGCGSGSVSVLLARNGYNVIGIDLSQDMLSLAQNKAFENDLNILFLNQDMTCFEYPKKVDAVISSLDCINYLSTIEEIKLTFKAVNNVLNFDGIFIFDINSEYKLKEILGNNTFVYEDDEAYCVWECGYFPEERVTSFDLNFFLKDDSGRYIRYSEYQEEWLYSIDEIQQAANECGFSDVIVYSDLTLTAPSDKSERIFFVLKK